jgi:hypothetical protein
VTRAHLPPSSRITCDGELLERPRLVRVDKVCPVCGATFTPKLKLVTNKVRRLKPQGLFVCSYDCALRMQEPLEAAADQSERRCGNRFCRAILAPGYRGTCCRLCRISRAISESLRKEAARDERLRLVLAAQRVYEEQTIEAYSREESYE